MQLKEYILGEYYCDILIIMSRHFTKEITGEYNTPLKYGTFISQINLSPTTILKIEAYNTYSSLSCVYTFINLDKPNDTRTEIQFRYYASDKNVLLHNMNFSEFVSHTVKIFKYNPDIVDVECVEEYYKISKEHIKLLYTCFQDAYKFLKDNGEVIVN